ncbi:MAG: hypothetical protein MSIBF_04365 [Candidatus Altiarchaeales archaeon IMC4]|nr:MAG: hypothetical protein MSIBF_04365 [Candidatus Altiarchaeales archaeon IMC4]
MKKDIEPILNEVKEGLKKIYGKRLEGLVLYGSHARGDADAGSDIDLIVLLDKVENPMDERKKFFDKIWALDMKYDTVISAIPFDSNSYRERNLPLLLNARSEGIYV